MKHHFKLSALLTLFVISLTAFGQVQLTLQIPNLGSPYLSDYISYQGNRVLIITNTTGEPREIYLRGKIEQLNQPGYYLRTKDNFKPATPITLAPFETKTLFANASDWAFLEERQLEDNIPSGEKRKIFATGILPEGEYQICVRAFDFRNDQPVSPDEPVGCQIFLLTLGSPPQILLPMCGDTIDQTLPLISWTPAILTQGLPAVQYDLYVVELTSRALHPEEVMEQSILYKGGNPFVVENLRTTYYQFLPGDPPLKKGKRYAICVVAKTKEGSAQFENKGRSEICLIHIREAREDQPLGPGTTGPSGPVVVAKPNDFQLMPFSTISGRLLYRFYEDGRLFTIPRQTIENPIVLLNMQGGQSLQGMGYQGVNQGANMTAQAVSGYGGLANAGFNNGNFQQPPPPQYILPAGYHTNGGKPLKNARIKFTSRLAVGKKPNIQHPEDLEFIGWMGYPVRVTGPGLPEQLVFPNSAKVVASTTTNGEGNYQVTFQAGDNYGLIEAGQVDVQWGGGEFPASASGYGLYRVITMEVQERWYCHPDIVIFLQPGQHLEAPVQVVHVQSYNLKLNIISTDKAQQYAGPGGPIPDAVVKIGRRKAIYDEMPSSFPKDEIKIQDYIPMMIGSPVKNYMVGDTGMTDINGKISFTRLVKHNGVGGCGGLFGSGNYPNDPYYVEAYSHPTIGQYNYHVERRTQFAPCAARLQFGCPDNDCAPRSADYVPPTVEETIELLPLLPEIYANSRVLYNNVPYTLPKTTLLMNVYHTDGTYRLGIYKTDENGLFKKQFTYPSDFYDKLIATTSAGNITTTYIMEYFKSGFKKHKCTSCGTPESKVGLQYGQRWLVEPQLLPGSYVRGRVKDEYGQALYGDVKIGDGPYLPLSIVYAVVQGTNPAQAGQPFDQIQLNLIAQMGAQGILPGNQPAGGIVASGQLAQTTQNQIQQSGYQVEYVGGILNSNKFEMQSVFSQPAQNGQQIPIIIRPDASNYFADTFYVNIPGGHVAPGFDLGTFVIKERLHRPKVVVYQKAIIGVNPNTLEPLIGNIPAEGAEVILSNFPAKQTNASGSVSYVFGSPSNEFRLRINKEGFVPYDEYIIIPVSKEEYVIEVVLEVGKTIIGQVTSMNNQQPIAGAKVYTEIGSNDYGPIIIQSETDQNGYYTLSGLPSGPLAVTATKADANITYIGQTRVVLYTPATNFNFSLQEAPFHLSHIWNLPVDLEKVIPSGNNWKISGAFVNLPENSRFKPENEEQRLFFSNVTIKPVGPPGADGKVAVEPVSDKISTQTNKFRSVLNDVHLVEMSGHISGGNQLTWIYSPQYTPVDISNIWVYRDPNGNGLVRTRTFTSLEYFRMTYNYNGQFFLGETSDNAIINAYKGIADLSMPEQYYLMDFVLLTGMARNPEFTVHNFDAFCDRRYSYVREDSFILATKLIVDLPQSNPDKLIVSTGNVVVLPNKIIVNAGSEPLEFDLETWHVKTNTWQFDPQQGGIVTSGIITTDLIEFPVPHILVKPTSLKLPPANNINLNQITLGGVLDLNFMSGAKLTFDYVNSPMHDPGKGHWRVVLSNQSLNNPVASLKSLPGWPAQDQVNIQFIENFSDGFRKLTIEPNQQVNHYNVIRQTVQHILISQGGVQLAGSIDLGIPNHPTGYNASFVYYLQQDEVKVRLQGLSTNFETAGQVAFMGDQHHERIFLTWNHFEVTGGLTIYDDLSSNEIKLRAKLIKKPNDIRLKIIDVDAGGQLEGNNKQIIALGGGSNGNIHVLQGEQKVVQNAWEYLSYQGKFVGFGDTFEEGGDAMWYKATGAVTNDQSKDDQIDLVDIETPFGDISISFDFAELALVGDLRIANIPMGSVYINEGVANLRVGGLGFYLVAHLDATYPVIGPLSTNFIVGYYPHLNPDAKEILKKDMYIKKLPEFLEQTGIQGLYICANKTFFEINWEVDLIVFGIGIYAEAGIDARFWLNFGESYGAAHIGGLAYADIELYANVLMVCEICFGLLAELGFDAEYQWQPTEQFDISICGSVHFNVSFCGTDFEESAKLILGWNSSSNDVYYDAILGETCSGNAVSTSGGCKHF